MKKMTLLGLTLLSCSALFAQKLDSRLLKPKLRSNFQKENLLLFKSGNTVQPKNGKYFANFGEPTPQWPDSNRFERTYFPSGNVKTETHYSLDGSNTPLYKYSYIYDSKDYVDLFQSYEWNGTKFVLEYESGLIKTYNESGILTNAFEFEVVNGDTSDYRSTYQTTFSGDTLVFTCLLPAAEAPNDEVMVYKFFKRSGASEYTDLLAKEWDGASEYDSYSFTKINWHNEFALERLLGITEYDLFFEYAEATMDQMVFKISGTFSPTSEVELTEIKQGIIYTPDSRESVNRDAQGNVSLYGYEYDYDLIDKSYYSFDREKITYTYENNNITRELHQTQYTGQPEYVNRYEFIYADFADVAGIKETPSKTIKFGPNPTSDFFQIHSSTIIDKVVVSDLNGKPICVNTVISGENASLNTSQLPAGLYICKISSANDSNFVRIQVVR